MYKIEAIEEWLEKWQYDPANSNLMILNLQGILVAKK